MKASVYYGPDDIRYEEVSPPEIKDGEVLVEVKACGLCGTDLSKIRERTVPPPAILGHEIAGEVIEIGQGVKGFRIGDRVIFGHHVPCFSCPYCRHENYTQCPQFKEINIDPGGFAEKVRVLRRSVEGAMLKIPDGFPYEEACLVESVACCLRGIRKCNIRSGDTVVIMGTGPIGLIHLQLACSLGGKVLAIDLVDYRLKKAMEFGATEAINSKREPVVERIRERTEGRGADVVIVAVGSPEAIAQAMDLTCQGGVVNIFAESPPRSLLRIDPNLIYHSEVRLIGSYSSTPLEQREALNLIKEKRIKIRELITHKFRLKDLLEAVRLAMRAQDSLKVIIVP